MTKVRDTPSQQSIEVNCQCQFHTVTTRTLSVAFWPVKSVSGSRWERRCGTDIGSWRTNGDERWQQWSPFIAVSSLMLVWCFTVFRTHILKWQRPFYSSSVRDHTLMSYMGPCPHIPYKAHHGILLLGQFTQNAFSRSIAWRLFGCVSIIFLGCESVYRELVRTLAHYTLRDCFLSCKMPPPKLLSCNDMYWVEAVQKMGYIFW